MIMPSQILLSIVVVFIITRTLIAFRDKNLSVSFALIWILFWLSVLFLIFQQQLVSNIAHYLKISRGVDLVIYISLIVIFYLLYRLLVALNEVDRKITKLVRNLALDDERKIKKVVSKSHK